jgi:NAD(P)-dependent dehydrogenase (short-subunit alcohol dehydrogenase family)
MQKIVLITGAASGIGRATAEAFVQNGFITYATSRCLETLTPLQKIGCEILELNVTSEPSMQAAVAVILERHGRIDVLVNNAGYGLNGPIEELEMNQLRHQFETNVFGLVRLTQLILPTMRQHQFGRIINVGSIGGTFTAPGAGAYHASKWALESITDALRFEVQSFGIDVSLIQPTGVYTQFDQKIASIMPDTGANSPYAYFKTNHRNVTERMFSSNSNAGIIKPEMVARVILNAANARKPRTRYKVGFSALVYSSLRKLVSDRVWDAIMGMQFPMQPRA